MSKAVKSRETDKTEQLDTITEKNCPIYSDKFGYETPIQFIHKMEVKDEYKQEFEDDWKELGQPLIPKRLKRNHRKYIRYLDAIKNDATDEYANRVEIKFIDDTLGYGLFAKEEIPARTVICNYVGELCIHEEADDHGYLFGFADTDFDEWVIDPRNKGNFAQFINHASVESDKNNVEVDYFFWDGLPHVFFMTDRKVEKGEQLMYDYGDDYWTDMNITPL